MEESDTLVSKNNGIPLKGSSLFSPKRFLFSGLVILFLVSVVIGSSSSLFESDTTTTTNEEVSLVEEVENDDDDDDDDDDEAPDAAVANCTENDFLHLKPNTYDYWEKEANCGSGYPLEVVKKPYRIHMLGETLGLTYKLTGCIIGTGHCPLNPQCTFTYSRTLFSKDVPDADMIMVTNFEGVNMMQRAVFRTKKQRQVKRVLHWREAYWPYISVEQQRTEFDLIMGVFMQADHISPYYFKRPNSLFHTKKEYTFLPFAERTHFAMSIISNCDSNSRRKTYINHLKDYLGAERIHEYGACGDRNLPPPPINRARKVIAKYKYYLSFENTLTTGYVSEKLYSVLNMQLVPIYMGGPEFVVNITTTPSFINAFDFATPKHLAQYLMYIEENPREYDKYHEWRTAKEPFTREYLELVKNKFPGMKENALYGRGNMQNRRAVCCRLCNEKWTEKLENANRMPISNILSEPQISKLLFAGNLNNRPGDGQMIAAPALPTQNDNEEEEEG